MSEKKRERILGIDLGTTNSAAAILEAGRPVTIPSAEGPTIAGKMFPSVVAFTKDGQLLIGDPARRQAVTNPEGTVFEIKRKMGTDYKVNLYGKEYSPQQISAFILQKIKQDAAAYLLGVRDFTSFCVAAHERDNRICNVSRASVSLNDGLVFRVEADRFLRGMVRAIVGTLVQVGRGRRRAADVDVILAAADRGASGPSAPPEGLFLKRVVYDHFEGA